jgi:hypothetical protein
MSNNNLMERTVNKGILIFAIQNTMFCPYCETILDVRRAVHLEAQKDGRTVLSKVLCAACFDKAKPRLDKMPYALEIIDGRELKGVRAAR